MDLFENLQIMKESNLKTEGIFKKDINVLCVKMNDGKWDPRFWSTDLNKVKEKQKELQQDKHYKDLEMKICDRKEAKQYNKDFEKSTGNLDESYNHKVNESTELRPFDTRDYAGWGGAHKFSDGSAPMIVDGEYATIIVSQSDEQVGTDEATIAIYYGDVDADENHWSFKGYDDKESAIKDAKVLAKLADDEIDESQLNRFGFTNVC